MYKELFTEAINAIKSHPLITVDELQLNEPATPQQIDAFEMIASIRLPQNIKDLYLFSNGIKCIWSLKKDIPEDVMEKIRREGEQFDFDYSKPLGAVNILSIQDMLLNKFWVPPFQKPPEQNQEIEFAGNKISMGAFTKQLRLFDAYQVHDDSEGVLLISDLPVNDVSFNLIMMDSYMASWAQSNIISFETYISVICRTRFTIPARKRVFGKEHATAAIKVNETNVAKSELLPALFK